MGITARPIPHEYALLSAIDVHSYAGLILKARTVHGVLSCCSNPNRPLHFGLSASYRSTNIIYVVPSMGPLISFRFRSHIGCLSIWLFLSCLNYIRFLRRFIDPYFSCYNVGGLSLFDESATLREGFTKPSRGLREAFAERVLEKASRSLHEPFAESYEPFAIAYTEGSTKTPWRVHEASSKGPWMNCMFLLLDDACNRVWSLLLYCFFFTPQTILPTWGNPF